MAPDWRRKIFKTHSQQDGDAPDGLYKPEMRQFAADAVVDYSTVDLFGDEPEQVTRRDEPPAQPLATRIFGQTGAVPADSPPRAGGADTLNPDLRTWTFPDADATRPLPAVPQAAEAAAPTAAAVVVGQIEADGDPFAFDQRLGEAAHRSAPAARVSELSPWGEPGALIEEPLASQAPVETEQQATPVASPWTEPPAAQPAVAAGPAWDFTTGWSSAEPAPRTWEAAGALPPVVSPTPPANPPAAARAYEEAASPRSFVTTQMEKGEAVMNDDTRLAEEISRRLGSLASQLGELAGAVMELERRQRERAESVQAVVAQISALSTQLHSVIPSVQEAPASGSAPWSTHAA